MSKIKVKNVMSVCGVNLKNMFICSKNIFTYSKNTFICGLISTKYILYDLFKKTLGFKYAEFSKIGKTNSLNRLVSRKGDLDYVGFAERFFVFQKAEFVFDCLMEEFDEVRDNLMMVVMGNMLGEKE